MCAETTDVCKTGTSQELWSPGSASACDGSEVLETPPPRTFLNGECEYVLDTVSLKTLHPYFRGESEIHRFSVWGHACPEDDSDDFWHEKDWYSASGQRFSESDYQDKLERRSFGVVESQEEEEQPRVLDKDRDREGYILSVRQRLGMDQPRTLSSDMVCLFWDCFLSHV